MLEKEQNHYSAPSKVGKLVIKDFFNNNYQVFCSVAFKYIQNTQVCEDIVQDIFVKLWEKQNLFKDHISAKAFCYKSIRNSCLDYIKHGNVEKKFLNSRIGYDDIEDSLIDNIIKAEAYNIVYQKINELPEMGKKVVLLSFDNFTNEEIATQLGIAINTVKTHKGRAYKFLRKELSDVFILLLSFRKKTFLKSQ